MIPYGRQFIDAADIEAVTETLCSDFITTGPKVAEFEKAVAEFADAEYGVAVSNGTAALHAAMAVIGVGAGDEVITTPMTFAASANCALYQGATPVFADVDPRTLLLDPAAVGAKITPATKAVIAVDYAGQPCDYDALRKICDEHGLSLVSDSCHSIGATSDGRRIGKLADIALFSFHPVKHLTTGEGGMLVTNSAEMAEKARIFRNHGITTDYRQRTEKGQWFYEMASLGFNYRITDFQCALGLSQLKKLPGWLARRREIARLYDREFADCADIQPLANAPGVENAYHLYVVQVHNCDRDDIFAAMRDAGIGVNVHYIPVHLHPYYRENLGTSEGLSPVAEAAFKRIISLPMFQKLTDEQVNFVAGTLKSKV